MKRLKSACDGHVWSHSVKRNCFVLISGSREDAGSPWVAMFQLLLIAGCRRKHEESIICNLAVLGRDTCDRYGGKDTLMCLYEADY